MKLLFLYCRKTESESTEFLCICSRNCEIEVRSRGRGVVEGREAHDRGEVVEGCSQRGVDCRDRNDLPYFQYKKAVRIHFKAKLGVGVLLEVALRPALLVLREALHEERNIHVSNV